MKLLLDFLPILIFFGAYKLTEDLITATAVLIPVTIIQVAVVFWLTKKVEKMALVTLALVIILGGLTVFLNDGWFIMWKPTVVNWLFAAAFFGSHFIGQRPIIKRLLGHAISLEAQQWVALSFAWIAFFIFSKVRFNFKIVVFSTTIKRNNRTTRITNTLNEVLQSMVFS